MKRAPCPHRYHEFVKQMTRDLNQFLALGPTQKRTLLVATVSMPLFWVGLRVLGLTRVHAWVRKTASASGAGVSTESMRAMGRLVNTAAMRTIGPSNCLTRSLVLDWLLHRRGIDSRLRIGVKIDKGSLHAHAWVEFDGAPINDRSDVGQEFLPFADLVPLEAFQG